MKWMNWELVWEVEACEYVRVCEDKRVQLRNNSAELFINCSLLIWEIGGGLFLFECLDVLAGILNLVEVFLIRGRGELCS